MVDRKWWSQGEESCKSWKQSWKALGALQPEKLTAVEELEELQLSIVEGGVGLFSVE